MTSKTKPPTLDDLRAQQDALELELEERRALIAPRQYLNDHLLNVVRRALGQRYSDPDQLEARAELDATEARLEEVRSQIAAAEYEAQKAAWWPKVEKARALFAELGAAADAVDQHLGDPATFAALRKVYQDYLNLIYDVDRWRNWLPPDLPRREQMINPVAALHNRLAEIETRARGKRADGPATMRAHMRLDLADQRTRAKARADDKQRRKEQQRRENDQRRERIEAERARLEKLWPEERLRETNPILQAALSPDELLARPPHFH